MNHDRVHAREPSHHVDRWSVGVIESIDERDGHCVVAVRPVESEEGSGESEDDEEDGDRRPVELVITLAVRDLFVGRLPIGDGESPVGERVWYRKRGG
ncbi:DUF7861 family protein [Halorubrum lacusprofundi]|jgi:hypothetical protein|uniref:Uncharacterized protein n=1 Tax=Halorubrum lacusprofundi (strain ATCC 49239 / DSM 5036 / JCM 8891 / ACAM 34) TaxID=416348 RepID=B9LUN8_HALLT|nr:hypothetical protein [Halorubrum lacusprofundi]ACM58305.1 conserved hypothetical protein [Halorubrum lacusprofundi ATCC 49239]MCG1006387.1 hypothetical protein [Halorubrum lacusprofundi]